jgi:hypothetical protein
MTIDMYQAILDALQGQSDQLRGIPAARLDWAGTGTALQLFEGTSGKDRARFIQAIGRIIEDHPLPPAATAELIHIASSLDLAEVEPQVRNLQTQSFAAQEDVQKAITNYLALRCFGTAQDTAIRATPRSAKGGFRPSRRQGKETSRSTKGRAEMMTMPRGRFQKVG